MLLVRVMDADADSEAVPVTDGEAGTLCVGRGGGRGNGATSDTEEGTTPHSAAAAYQSDCKLTHASELYPAVHYSPAFRSQ